MISGVAKRTFWSRLTDPAICALVHHPAACASRPTVLRRHRSRPASFLGALAERRPFDPGKAGDRRVRHRAASTGHGLPFGDVEARARFEVIAGLPLGRGSQISTCSNQPPQNRRGGRRNSRNTRSRSFDREVFLGSVAKWKFDRPACTVSGPARCPTAQRHQAPRPGNFPHDLVQGHRPRPSVAPAPARPWRGPLSTTSISRVGRAEADGIALGLRSGHWRGSKWYCPRSHDRLRPERQARNSVAPLRSRISWTWLGQVRGPRAYPPPPSAQPFFQGVSARAAGVKPHHGAARHGDRPQASSMRRKSSASSAIWLSTAISSSILRTP